MRYVPEFIVRAYDRTPPWSRSVASSLYGWVKTLREDTPQFRDRLRELEASQGWGIGRLEELQAERVQRLIAHAARSVPYYRRLFSDHGINPGQIQTPQDLSRIPPLKKEVVRSNPTLLLAEGTDVRRLRTESTSGTTGSPLRIFIDGDTYDYHRAVQWLHHAWAGYTHREWIGVLAGYKVIPVDHQRPPFWVTNYAGRQVHFSSYHLHRKWVPSFVRKIRSSGIRFLVGYPSAIGLLARHVLELGDSIPLQAVFLSSEPVLPWQTDAIRSAFGASIFHYYGSTERAAAAVSCGQAEEPGSMHVAMEICVVEVAPDPETPTLRRIFGTSLTNFTMPLIRYETGDVTTDVVKPCACGRGHRRIGPIETRTADYLTGSSGSLISPWLVTRVFSPEKVVAGFQIVQHEMGRLIVRVVPGPGFSATDEERLRRNIQAQVGSGMTVTFEQVAAIERTSNGKVRVVISTLEGNRTEAMAKRDG
jgi:phenylacetate-CoA ligase